MTNFHTHTSFSDGRDTPEKIVLKALELGMTQLGFSDHSFAPFDLSCGILPEKEAEYRACIAALKEKYRGRIRLFCGLEQDYYSPPAQPGYDYLIGSVHYVLCGDSYIAVDDTPQQLRRGIDTCCGGDAMVFAESYWALEGNVVNRTGCSIIGHLDLIRKFNRDGSFFEEDSVRYKRAAIDAIDSLLATGIPFEVNTGAISRGWQDTPYPSDPLRDYIRARGGLLLLSSDSHSIDTLCYGFDRFSSPEYVTDPWQAF